MQLPLIIVKCSASCLTASGGRGGILTQVCWLQMPRVSTKPLFSYFMACLVFKVIIQIVKAKQPILSFSFF